MAPGVRFAAVKACILPSKSATADAQASYGLYVAHGYYEIL